MGLDMYLDAKEYISPYWDKREIRDTLVEVTGNDKVKGITYEVGYWRKANQIHNWFVNNVQDGRDDCGTYFVHSSKLNELKSICEEVLEGSEMVDAPVIVGYRFEGGKEIPMQEQGQVISNAELAAELLPVSEGFFFGSQEYSHWYVDDLKETIKICDRALEMAEDPNISVDFYYHSSW